MVAEQSRSHRMRIFLRQAIRRVRVSMCSSPRRIAPSARPKPLGSHGRGPAQPPGRSSPHVGARWPHTHSASLGGRKDVGKWPGSRRSWRVGTVRQDGGEIWEPQTGFFCLSTLRPLQPLRHDCIADTSPYGTYESADDKPARPVSPELASAVRDCACITRLAPGVSGAPGKLSLTPGRRRHKTSMAVVPVVTTVTTVPMAFDPIDKKSFAAERGRPGWITKQ